MNKPVMLGTILSLALSAVPVAVVTAANDGFTFHALSKMSMGEQAALNSISDAQLASIEGGSKADIPQVDIKVNIPDIVVDIPKIVIPDIDIPKCKEPRCKKQRVHTTTTTTTKGNKITTMTTTTTIIFKDKTPKKNKG